MIRTLKLLVITKAFSLYHQVSRSNCQQPHRPHPLLHGQEYQQFPQPFYVPSGTSLLGDFISLDIEEKSLFSFAHIQSSALFSRYAQKIELDYDGKFSDELIAQHRAYVTAAIFSSVAFLEAQINEFFTGVNDVHLKSNFSDPHKKNFELAWSIIGHRRIWCVEKYNIALKCAEKPKFESQSQIMQEIGCLRELRNKLVHYEPRWFSVLHNNLPTKNTREFEIKLVGKFKTNPLTGEGNAFFPSKCLSHGCARWAIENSLAFSDEFFTRMSIPKPYEHIRKRLQPYDV